jgi:hypothetical protein
MSASGKGAAQAVPARILTLRRELRVTCVQEWRVNSADLPEWDGEEDSLVIEDWTIIDVGDLLSEEILFDLEDDDAALGYTIEGETSDA